MISLQNVLFLCLYAQHNSAFEHQVFMTITANLLKQRWPTYGMRQIWRIGWFEVVHCIPVIVVNYRNIVNLSNVLTDFCFVQIPFELPVIILKQAVHDFLKDKNELIKERYLLCDNKWLFDLTFIGDVTNHLNHLNMALAGLVPKQYSKTPPNWNMRHYKSVEFFQFSECQALLHKRKVPLLKTFWRRFWCVAEDGNWENALKRSNYCKIHLNVLQDFCDFANKEDWILAFINPFLLSEQKIMKMLSSVASGT